MEPLRKAKRRGAGVHRLALLSIEFGGSGSNHAPFLRKSKAISQAETLQTERPANASRLNDPAGRAACAGVYRTRRHSIRPSGCNSRVGLLVKWGGFDTCLVT